MEALNSARTVVPGLIRFKVGVLGWGLRCWTREFEEVSPDELDKNCLGLVVLDDDAND